MIKKINRLLTIFLLITLTACQSLSSLFSSVEKMADDTAIAAKVSQEALSKDTDVEVTIRVTNKEMTP
jgi:hypothetical protein